MLAPSTFHLIVAELLAAKKHLARGKANTRVGLKECFWDQAHASWQLRFLLFIIGIIAVL